MAAVTPAEVRAAKSFLGKRKLPISARRLASASKEQGKSFRELISFIMRIYQGQTNQASQRREVILAAANSGSG